MHQMHLGNLAQCLWVIKHLSVEAKSRAILAIVSYLFWWGVCAWIGFCLSFSELAIERSVAIEFLLRNF